MPSTGLRDRAVGIDEEEREEETAKGWFLKGRFVCPRVFYWSFSIFPGSEFYYCHKKSWNTHWDVSLWLVHVLVPRVNVCVHACDRVHEPMCKAVPVFAECRQTDEGKTERHISFIGSLGVLLFCFGGLSVLVHTVLPWPHMYCNVSDLTTHLASYSILKS